MCATLWQHERGTPRYVSIATQSTVQPLSLHQSHKQTRVVLHCLRDLVFTAWNAATTFSSCCRVQEHLKGQEFGNGEWHKVVSMPNRAEHVAWQDGAQSHAFSRSALCKLWSESRLPSLYPRKPFDKRMGGRSVKVYFTPEQVT